MDIFHNISKKCLEKNIVTYKDMANIINTSESFIKQVASGRSRFNIGHISVFAEALNCSMKDFFN